MKRHVRALACGAALFAAIVAAGCGGKQTVASKSAAAFDEAKRKGIPIPAGEHGGHSAEAGSTPPPAATATDHVATGTDHAAMAPMDHRAMPGMDHRAMPGMDHSKMTGMPPSSSGAAAHDMAGMDHSKMPVMQHGTAGGAVHTMPGMDHSAKAGMAHGAMPGMDHAKAMPGMQHGAPAAAPIDIAPPITNAAIAQTQPAAVLRPDDFDSPAPSSVDEAKKAAQPMPGHHQGHGK
jgi:uncharacterized protein involved in copper resistance